MPYPAANKFSALVLGLVTLASCGTSQSMLNKVEDDVYHSRKESRGKDVYVPEVDVNEIMKQNPPRYGEGQEKQYDGGYNDNTNINPNAASGYLAYRNRTQETVNGQRQVITVPDQEVQETTDDAAYELRNQYAGVYNNSFNTNLFYTNPWYARRSFWGRPAFSLGWNSFNGWGLGWGLNWNNGWGNSGWCSPFYNYYDPFNNWGWNNSWYDPYCGYYPYYGWNNWNNGWGYSPWWNHRDNGGSRGNSVARVQRNSPGTNMPRAAEYTQRPSSGVNGQGQVTPQPDPGRVAMPRSLNEAQLVNRNGQQIYVAPEQYRPAAPPRSFETFEKSVQQNKNYREVMPIPAPAPSTVRNNPAPASNSGRNDQRVYQSPEPVRQSPAPRVYERTPTPTPMGGGNGGGGSFGGSRGGASGGSSGGGRPSMPRPR